MYFVYLLKCRNGAIYTGITTDIERRFREHKAGTASKYTRANKAAKVLYTERFPTRSTASKREAEIKSWPRKEKLALVQAR